MKPFAIALLIMGITYVALNFFGKINTEKQLDLNSAISQCSRNLDLNQCTVDKIMSIIKNSTNSTFSKKDHSLLLWTADNKLIDFSDLSNEIVLDTSKLNNYQKLVWNSYLIDSKNKQGYKFMNDNGLISIAVIIIYIFVALWAVFAFVPFIWRFFLKRVSEVSKAVKGDKLD
jgi:hypothetical protein